MIASSPLSRAAACAALSFVVSLAAFAQSKPTNPDAGMVGGDAQPAAKHAPAPEGITAAPASREENLNRCWNALSSPFTENMGVDTRIHALSGLGLLGRFKQAQDILREAVHSPDLDVRIAAIQSAGETKNPGFVPDLRALLDDKEPQVAFSAAVTLWKMDDPSGEDLLLDVVRGERSASGSFLQSSVHNANRQLHSPSSLARIGAMQGAMILLPPVGIGMGAYGYLKGNPGESPRVLALEQLAHKKTPTIRAELISATTDKDTGVRLAAAEALAEFTPGADALKAITLLFDDRREEVRMIAFATYIRLANAPAKSAPKTKKH